MKNENYTPRERVDKDLLTRLLREEDASCAATSTGGEIYTPDVPCSTVERAAVDTGTTFPSLAMVYAPMQTFDNLYEAEAGLARGTIFAGLDLPFCPPAQERRCRL